jgi:hypothetical protein
MSIVRSWPGRAGLLLLLAACGGAGDRTPPGPAAVPGSVPGASVPAPSTTPPPSVEALVDSALRAFRSGLPNPGALSGGESSREQLVERFVRALAARDSATLRRLHLTRAEYAWLYFPTSRLARPPYGIDPAFLWQQISASADRDVARAMAAVGRTDRHLGQLCPDSVLVEGANRVHERCQVVLRRGAGTDTLILHGSVLERDGQFKFVSYANQL